MKLTLSKEELSLILSSPTRAVDVQTDAENVIINLDALTVEHLTKESTQLLFLKIYEAGYQQGLIDA